MAKSKPLRPVQYGAPTDKCAITVRLGVEAGIFEEEGLDLSVRVVFGGPEIAAAYDSGDLEIGEFGSPPAINAIAAGKRFKIVGSGCRQRAQLYFCAAKGIDGYAELKGRRVGVLGIGSCSDWITRKMVGHHGLDPDRDIEIVPLLGDYPRVVDLVAEGTLDACMITEPNVAIGEERGVLDFWAAGFEDAYLPDYQWIVRVARDELIERDPDFVRAVLRGCRKSAHYAATHTDEWVELAARQYGASEAAARRAVERELPHFQLDCRLDMAGLQAAADLQYKLGGIEKPVRAKDLVDSRFVPDGKMAA
jgi:NitT/TauT family transport system substrate-binding protein